MSQIHKLDDDLINKIAAGEVVERPASVVKELVENAVDAGSSKIVITISDGGKKLIRIADDGKGIPAEQLEMAVSRHATSKITQFEDLYCLQTKGFRGEALASICSVAKVTLSSCTAEGEPSEIIVEGGQLIDQRACAQPLGTTITVKYLFYQTPARLKFLKTAPTETSHVVDVVTRMALSHPHIAFTLLKDDKTLIEVKKNQDLQQRMVALLGKDLADYLYNFSAEVPGMKVKGLLGHPQVSRSQRHQTFFFVNGRSVNDKVLWHATLEAYRDLLMKGRYPVLVMDLWVDEKTVDVNVHPTKAEIRFHQSQQVHHFVYRALRDKLKESPWLADGFSSSQASSSAPAIRSYERASAPSSNSPSTGTIKESVQGWSQKFFQDDESQKTFLSDQSRSQGYSSAKSQSPQRQIQFGRTQYADMNPIGQLLGTYILCEGDGKMVLIDQHAAHERIGFEKLMLQYQKEGIPCQPLLVPETFDLKPSDADVLKNYVEDFAKFGFEIEFFGGHTFVLKAVPTLLEGKIEISSLLQNLIGDIRETGELVSLKDKLHHVLATMSCHAQIRAHHHLSFDEMKALLTELEEYQFTDFCPHGRPVSVEVTLDEIEKWFKRVL